MNTFNFNDSNAPIPRAPSPPPPKANRSIDNSWSTRDLQLVILAKYHDGIPKQTIAKQLGIDKGRVYRAV
jgi:hypothetical protein